MPKPKFNLKNYTTEVPVSRTLARIEQRLAEAGCAHIMKDYEDGAPKSLSFTFDMNGMRYAFRLPVRIHAVFSHLKGQFPRTNRQRLGDQAARVAWRLMEDWINVQFSLIHTEQVDFMQVFLPYSWDGQRTFYERMVEEDKVKKLGRGTPDG